jgi:hypothetical protein
VAPDCFFTVDPFSVSTKMFPASQAILESRENILISRRSLP